MAQLAFISSVIADFSLFREAARRAAEKSGYAPILVNEDFPARATSSRTACLDAVASSDVYIGVLGARGGFRTPAGKLVVEEEYEEAVRRNIPTLFFVHDTEHDSDQEAFLDRVSDFIDGHFRVGFSTPEELETAISAALSQLEPGMNEDPVVAAEAVSGALSQPKPADNREVLVRLSIAPVRTDELVHPRLIDDGVVHQELLRLGHDSKAGFFEYALGYAEDKNDGAATIRLAEPYGAQVGNRATAKLSDTGLIVLESNVMRLEPPADAMSMQAMHVIAEEHIELQLGRGFSFASMILDHFDEFGRYDRLVYNAGLLGVSYQTMERKPAARSSYRMRMGDAGALIAFDKPRMITRAQMLVPEDEIARTITMFRRQLSVD